MAGRKVLRNLAGFGRRAKEVLREIRDDVKKVAFTKAANCNIEASYIAPSQPSDNERSTLAADKPSEEEGTLVGSQQGPAEAGVVVSQHATVDEQAVAGALEQVESRQDEAPAQAAPLDQESIESDETLPASTRATYLAMAKLSSHDQVDGVPSAALAAANGTIVQLTYKLDQARLDLLASKTDALSCRTITAELQGELKSEQQTLAAIRVQLNNAELLSNKSAQKLQRTEEQHADIVEEKQAEINTARNLCQILVLQASNLFIHANAIVADCNEKIHAQKAIQLEQLRTLTARNEEITSLKMKVESLRDNHTRELNARRSHFEAHTRRQTLSAAQESKRRDEKEAAQEAELNVLRTQLTLHANKEAVQEYELVELRKQLAKRDEEVATLKRDVDDRDKALSRRLAAIRELRRNYNSTAGKLINANAELAGMKRELAATTDELDGTVEVLETTQADLDKANADLVTLRQLRANGIQGNKRQMEKLKADCEAMALRLEQNGIPVHSAEQSCGDPPLLVEPHTLASASVQEIFEAGNLTLQERLQSGAQGTVYLVRSSINDKLYVMKVQTLAGISLWATSNDIPREAFVRNVALRGHEDLVRLHGYKIYAPVNDRYPYRAQMFFEYCNGGDLEHLTKELIDHQLQLHEQVAWHFLKALARGLYNMHGWQHNLGKPEDEQNKGVVVLHRDIKPGNIFLRQPEDKMQLPDIVFGDFGFASWEERSDGAMGTQGYDAPELQPYLRADEPMYAKPGTKIVDKACDVYALGATLQRLLTRNERRDDGQWHSYNAKGLFMLQSGRAIKYSKDLWEFVGQMMSYDPTLRYPDGVLGALVSYADRRLSEMGSKATVDLAIRRHKPWPQNLGIPLLTVDEVKEHMNLPEPPRS